MTFSPDAPDQARRLILKSAVAGGLAGLGLGSFPFPAFAAADAKDWPADAFKQKSEADALKALYGKSAESSDKVSLDAPEIAENGAVVPIEITSRIPGTQSIAVVIDKNPFPLVAKFDFHEGALPFVKLNVKMGETSAVRAIATAGGRSYATTKEIKVTIGGCGG